MILQPVHSPSYNLADQRRMAVATNYFAWQARLVTPFLGPRVIEVGCGTGNFTSALVDREAVLALDNDAGCIEHIGNRFRGSTNLRTMICDASDLRRAEIAAFRANSCVCLNVLEHVEDDGDAVRAMASLIPRGGSVVLIVPAFPALRGPIDRNLGHFRRYTRRSIAGITEASGLRIKTLRYMNFVGFFGWWVNAHILRKTEQSAKQIYFFDRFIVPVLSRVEEIVPPPFGQSLFVVLEKR